MIKKIYTTNFKHNIYIKYLLIDYKEFLLFGKSLLKKEDLTNEEFLNLLFYHLYLVIRLKKLRSKWLDLYTYSSRLKRLKTKLKTANDLVNNIKYNLADIGYEYNKFILDNIYSILYNMNTFIPNMPYKKFHQILPWALNFIEIFNKFTFIDYILPRMFLQSFIDFGLLIKNNNIAEMIETMTKKFTTQDVFHIKILQFLYKIQFVGYDHVSSGLQNIGLILNDKNLLEYTNVIKSENKNLKTLVLTILEEFIKFKATNQEELPDNSKINIDLKIINNRKKTANSLNNIPKIMLTSLGINRKTMREKNMTKKEAILYAKNICKNIFDKREYNIPDPLFIPDLVSASVFKEKMNLLKTYINDRDYLFLENIIFSKDTVKKIVMPKSYNSTQYADSIRLRTNLFTYITFNKIESNDYKGLFKLISEICELITKFINQEIHLKAHAIKVFQIKMQNLLDSLTENTNLKKNDGVLVNSEHLSFKLTPKKEQNTLFNMTAYDPKKKKLLRSRRILICNITDEIDINKLYNSLNANFIQSLDSAILFQYKYLLYNINHRKKRTIAIHDTYIEAANKLYTPSSYTIQDLENYKEFLNKSNTKTIMLNLIRISLFRLFKKNPLAKLYTTNDLKEEYIPKGLFDDIEDPLENLLNSNWINYLIKNSHVWSLIELDPKNPSQTICKPNVQFFVNSLSYLNDYEKNRYDSFIKNIIYKHKTLYRDGLFNNLRVKNKQKQELRDYITVIENKFKTKFILDYLKQREILLKNHILSLDKNSLTSKLTKILNNDNIIMS